MISSSWICYRATDLTGQGYVEKARTPAQRLLQYPRRVSSLANISSIYYRLLKNSDPRLFKKVQMRGAREIDKRRRIY
jgi:hypothetical protein